MRLFRSILTPLSAAVLGAAALQPAAAQQATLAANVRPAVGHAAAAADPVRLRTLAVYRFTASPIAGLPSEVTVADSSGELVASFRRPGTADAVPMVVDVLGADITLHGATPAGVLTLVLYGENDPNTSGALVGRWMVGGREGVLRGHTER
jgi:hypothetical protein